MPAATASELPISVRRVIGVFTARSPSQSGEGSVLTEGRHRRPSVHSAQDGDRVVAAAQVQPGVAVGDLRAYRAAVDEHDAVLAGGYGRGAAGVLRCGDVQVEA